MDSLLDPLRFRFDRLPSPAFMPREDDYTDLLRSPDFDTRLQAFNRLTALSRRDPEWFTNFSRKGEFFKNIDRILADDRWEIQHQCIKFLQEAMSTFGSNLEYCICYVMPNLVPKLGSSKITVRKISIQAIQTFLRLKPDALGSVLKTLSNFLLTSTERVTKTEVVKEFPVMYIPELAQCDWSTLLDSLTKLMATSETESAEGAALAAKKLEVYLGKDVFNQMLSNISVEQQKDYLRLSKNMVVAPEPQAAPSQPFNRSSMKLASGERRFRFGIIPSIVATMVLDSADSATRIGGLEKWKQVIENITHDEISRIVPHLHSYLISLNNVLTDLNFKVVVLALDVVRLTVNRLKSNMEAHLQQTISLIAQHFGNQKAVVKQLIMMTCMDLFQNVNPKAVVGVLCVYLEHRNSRVREEVINILTSALMIISASRINFNVVVNILVPLLLDPKRRVRLAVFEQLSVVAYLMNGKVDILLRAVRDMEVRHSITGLSAAVTARLRRQTLPRIRYDGLIEYSTPPVTDSSFNVTESELTDDDNLDLNWILHAGEVPNRPISPMSMVAGVTKAYMALKPDKTLPWENGKDTTCLVTMDRMKSDDQIVRRHDDSNASQDVVIMGSAVTRASSAKVRPVQRAVMLEQGRTTTSLDADLRGARKSVLTPSSSTGSWHMPKRNNSLASEDRSISAAISRVSQKTIEVTAIPNGVPPPEGYKKNELNNNHIPLKKPVGTPPSNLSKAKSEGSLNEEVENSPPANHDDMPIKPAKGGQYFDELSHSDGYGALVKKSVSHHSLPVNATNHAPLKNTKSIPVKKNHVNGKIVPSASHKNLSNGHANGKLPKAAQPTTPGRGAANGIPPGQKTVQNALKKIESEEWSDKVDGINLISELSDSNPKEVADHMHEVVVAVLNECKNLRSCVSRVALVCAGTLTQNMKSKMDTELDKLCVTLIHRAGDVSNAFIREDANEALEKVVKHASAGKALHSIITAGSKSKNNTIRASCAGFVGTLVSRMGVSALLNTPDQLSKIVPHLIAFCKDANPQVRMHGKQTLMSLSQDPDFDRQLKKSVSDSELKAVKEILADIGKKGGIDSLDSTSTSLGASLSRSGSIRKAVQRKLPDNVQLDLDEIKADLTAAGWERRIGGLKRFLEMTITAPKAIASDTKLMEAFIGRLNDINSKVSLEGLDTYLASLGILSKMYSAESHLKAVLNQLVLALMSHLSSKSEEHRSTAQKCLRDTVVQIDPASLSPAMAAATRKANIKQKPYMLSVFNRLNFKLYPAKPKQVEVVALPILWDSLKSGVADLEMKKAVTEFAKGLTQLMGERALLDQASMELDPSRKKLLESLIR